MSKLYLLSLNRLMVLPILWTVLLPGIVQAEGVLFVDSGKPLAAKFEGPKWEQTSDGLRAEGKNSLLLANKRIEVGDFRISATITLARLDVSAAAIVINNSFVGFDGEDQRLFVEGPLFGGKTKLLDPATDYFQPGQPFELEIVRQSGSLRVLINAKEVLRKDDWNDSVQKIGLRPWRNQMTVAQFRGTGNFKDIATKPSPSGTAVFVSGEGHHTYRIPTLVTSKKGTLLALCEGRNSQADHGDVDIVLRRSEDGGKTWKPQQLIMDDGSHQLGNPSATVDHETGRIFLMFCGSHHSEGQVIGGTGSREVFLSYSDDDGLTWSPRRNISAMTKKTSWRWYAIGPCSGIQVQTGKHKGRLVFPANHSVHYDDGRKWEYRCHALYSDDQGKTWQIGSTSEVGCSETQIAEVAPDLLIQDIRMQTNCKGYRAVRYSSDGGATWTPITHDPTRVDPKCQGSAISVVEPGNSPYRLYSSNPAGGGRTGMTAYTSTDGGRLWQKIGTLFEGPSAYSDLTITQDHKLACLYEGGKDHVYTSIVFQWIATP